MGRGFESHPPYSPADLGVAGALPGWHSAPGGRLAPVAISFVLRLVGGVHRSTRKHGVADQDSLHAAQHALAVYQLEDEDGPVRKS